MSRNTPSEPADIRKMLLELLQVANRHVAESGHRITRQRHLIARLQTKGQATSTAESFLDYLRTARVVYLAGRERLQLELAALDVSPGPSSAVRLNQPTDASLQPAQWPEEKLLNSE
jgi:hypothetical protein